MSLLFVKDNPKAAKSESNSSDERLDGRADFDFLVGSWNVRHHRLRNRLVGDTCWDDFAGIAECRPIVGGLSNIDDNCLYFPSGFYRAATLRVFNPETRLWSIWWIDGRAPRVDRPVHGSFLDGKGTFYGDETSPDGSLVKIRFTWSEIESDTARWEQAMSNDDGSTWEDNWVMHFTRDR